MDRADIRLRLERIRWPVSDWAIVAGVNKHTAHRMLGDHNDTRTSKFNALEAALAAEEIAMRDYLNRLHPARATALEAAE